MSFSTLSLSFGTSPGAVLTAAAGGAAMARASEKMRKVDPVGWFGQHGGAGAARGGG